jgi:hypothetical protein
LESGRRLRRTCKAAWGKPKEINKTVVSGEVHEQWVYEDSYLTIVNGVLAAIQN